MRKTQANIADLLIGGEDGRSVPDHEIQGYSELTTMFRSAWRCSSSATSLEAPSRSPPCHCRSYPPYKLYVNPWDVSTCALLLISRKSGLVFNTICATLILGEPFTRWSVGGTVLVCAGAVLIAIFGAIPEPAHNLDQLLALLGRKQFILWMIGQAIIVATTISGAKAVKYMRPWAKNTSRMRLFRGLAYGGVSGILSAHSLLVAKSAVELLVRTIVDHHNQFDRWQSWVILLALLALALFQLYYLHRGLRLCSTSVLYPFVFCVYNIIAILDGLIYFHETSRLTLLHGLLVRYSPA